MTDLTGDLIGHQPATGDGHRDAPRDHAWLWHAQGAGEYLLTRREAAILDVIRRGGPDGIVTGQIASAIQDGARYAAGLESRSHVPVSNMRVASFYAVLESLEQKGFAKVVGSGRASGRPARRYGLTDLGGRAAAFADALASRMVEIAGAAAKGRERVGMDLLTLLVDTRSSHAVMTSDGGGYRVDKVHGGRYLTVSEGPPDRHAAILTWLRTRAGLQPDDATSEGSFTHRTSAEGGVAVEVAVRVTSEVVGHRTTIALRQAP